MSFDLPWKEHYGSHDAQKHAAELGMWIFLATEVLLFGALFVLYGAYRWTYTEVFREEIAKENLWYGGIMTVLLLTSSFCVAQAVHSIRKGREVATAVYLFVAVALAAGFLALHGLEYATHAREGKLPGEWYSASPGKPGTSLFYSLFWLMTGLHVTHVTIGCAVLSWMAIQSFGGKYSETFHTPIVNGALYWQLVDTIWMFLFPIFYLAH